LPSHGEAQADEPRCHPVLLANRKKKKRKEKKKREERRRKKLDSKNCSQKQEVTFFLLLDSISNGEQKIYQMNFYLFFVPKNKRTE